MISQSKMNVNYTIILKVPQAYEYDSATQSVVLLKDYLYNVYYSNENKDYQEIVDLRGPVSDVIIHT